MTKILDPDNAVVITDFDGTLTQKFVSGHRVPSLMSMLLDEKYLSRASIKEIQALYSQYNPIEISDTIDNQTKVTKMQEWWTKCYQILQENKLNKQMIEDLANSPLLKWRDKLISFLHKLNNSCVPMIIFSSSGIGTFAIKYILAKHDLYFKNIQVCSNTIKFDQDGFFIGAKPPIIHIANKSGNTLIKHMLITKNPTRKQCLLLGDSPEDTQMAHGINFDQVYKVAFAKLNEPVFQTRFDQVLPEDGDYQQIIDLFNWHS